MLSRDRDINAFTEISPQLDRNSCPEQTRKISLSSPPVTKVNIDQSSPAVVESCMFVISPPLPNRLTVIDTSDNSYVPAYIHRKAKPAPSTTWKTSFPFHKSSVTSKTITESSSHAPDTPQS